MNSHELANPPQSGPSRKLAAASRGAEPSQRLRSGRGPGDGGGERSRRAGRRGFSLPEILIALAVVALLAAIALPAYREHVLKTKRREAIAALGTIQLEQEKWRGTASSYGTLAELQLPALSQEGNYALAIGDVSATTYTATATAIGPQAADTACATLVVTQTGPDLGSEQKRACWQQ